MIYAVKHGVTEKAILKQAAAQRGPIPEFILSAPELETGLEFLYTSYQKLSSCRPSSMSGALRIPWTAISQYCRDYCIEGEEREDFEYVMGRVDEAYITYINDKAEAERKKAESAPRKVSKRR